jgi:hypothetical protein
MDETKPAEATKEQVEGAVPTTDRLIRDFAKIVKPVPSKPLKKQSKRLEDEAARERARQRTGENEY